ncbi:hypothetical protein DL93DRAFT_149660 [Clavulina sp. PMI_390]|nr:hypothetical protein DL93DRAFT_149660 [Clavulina sp. PMI_390]
MTSMRSAVKSESEYWMNSPTSSVPHSPSTCSATPPRTISSSSIGSTAPLPTIFAYADEPLSERPQLSWNPGSRPGGYFYTPPPSSPTEPSSHYSGATPYGPPSASLRAQRDPHRSPSVLPLPIPSSARHHQYPSPSTQEPHPYLPHPTGRHRAGSLNTYTMRSEADSKAVAALAFRPF